MPIAFKCDCGRKFRTADENAGRRTTCPDCRVKLTVPTAEIEDALPVVEVADLERLAYEAEGVQVAPTRRREPEPRPYDRPRRDEPYRRDGDSGQKRLRYRDSDIPNRIVRRSSYSSGGLSGVRVIVGLLMMVGAVFWFVLGLADGFLFTGSIFLFISGLVCLMKGIANGR